MYISGLFSDETVNVTHGKLIPKQPSSPDIKRTLVAMSRRTEMTVSQVADEVLSTGLIEMLELLELSG